MLAASSPFPGRLGCSRYRSGIREFWQARTSEAGALPSLHVMPIKAAYGRLPWEVPVLPFGTREPLTALAQGNLPKVLSSGAPVGRGEIGALGGPDDGVVKLKQIDRVHLQPREAGFERG